MPQVPIYGAPKVKAASTPVPNLQTNVPVPNIAGAVNQVVNVVSDIRQQANETAVLEAERQAMDLEFQTFDAPETGYLNKQGKDAIEGYQQTLEAYDGGMSKIRESLKNDEQRVLFDQKVAIARRQQAMLKGARHVSQERDRFDAANLKAYVENVVTSAAANYADPARIGYDIGRGAAEIDAYAKRAGLPQEAVDGMKADLETKAHRAVIDRYMATPGNAKQAKAYFDAVKDRIAGDQRDEVEKELSSFVALDKATTAVDDVFAEAQRTGDFGAAETKLIATLQGDPEAQRQARVEFKQRQAAFESSQQTQVGKAMQWAMANGKYAYAAVPREFRAGLTPENDVKLREWLDGKVDASKQKVDPADKERALNLWYQLGRDPSLKDKDLAPLAAYFLAVGEEARFDQLVREQDAQRKGKAGDEWAMAKPTLDARLATLGIKPKDKRSSQAEDYIRRQIESERLRLGRALDRKQVDDIIDQAFLKGEIQGTVWDTGAYQFEAPYIGDDVAGGVPLADFQKIRDTLRAAGQDDSPEAVQSLYRRYQQQAQ